MTYLRETDRDVSQTHSPLASQGTGPIPPNSPLVFYMELVRVHAGACPKRKFQSSLASSPPLSLSPQARTCPLLPHAEVPTVHAHLYDDLTWAVAVAVAMAAAMAVAVAVAVAVGLILASRPLPLVLHPC